MVIYYIMLSRMVNTIMPFLVILAALALLWFVLQKVRRFTREAIIDGVECYARIHSARLDVSEREAALQAQQETFKAKIEAERRQARRLLLEQRKTLQAGLPLTVNQRFASGEFDVELEDANVSFAGK